MENLNTELAESNIQKEIVISKPYIEDKNNGLCRLCAEIDVAGEKDTVFVEVENSYRDVLLVERADAFLFLCMPIAMREGYNIRCEAPVTEMFLHNLSEILLPAYFKNDKRVKEFEIIAKSDNMSLENRGGVGTSVTCGVDSTYTIMKYTKDDYSEIKLSHLLVGSISLDLWNFSDDDDLYSWEAKYPFAFERYENVSEYTGLPIVKVFTNFIPFITNRKSDVASYRHTFTNVYITMSVVLALKKLFKVYLSPSGYDFSHFNLSNIITTDAAHYELLIMHVLSHPGFMLFTEGGCIDRIDKTRELADYPLARKILHPCFRGGRNNCSSPTCNKCKRALFAFDVYDKLDEMSEIYDIKRYREHRDEYLIELIKLKDDAFFSRLYEMFLEKYPEDMERARLVYEDSIRPISREEYNDLVVEYDKLRLEFNGLKREYGTSLALLSKDIPKETIVNYFKYRGVNKLYYVGKSQIGSKLIRLLSPEIEIVTIKTGDINDCDAAFVASPYNATIKELRKKVRRKAGRKIPVYSILDLKKELSTEI